MVGSDASPSIVYNPPTVDDGKVRVVSLGLYVKLLTPEVSNWPIDHP